MYSKVKKALSQNVMKDVMNNTQQSSYLLDAELYTIWKYIKGFKEYHPTVPVDFRELAGSNEDVGSSSLRFINTLHSLGLEMHGMTFQSEWYQQRYTDEHTRILDHIMNNPETKISMVFRRVLDGTFTLDDVKQLCMNASHSMLGYFQFSQPPQEDRRVLYTWLAEYIA